MSAEDDPPGVVFDCVVFIHLAKAQNDNGLQPSTKVMVRILKTKSENLASRLLITTNTQNKITSRDLHAQDKIQEDIQREFERRFGLRYERMANESSLRLSCWYIGLRNSVHPARERSCRAYRRRT